MLVDAADLPLAQLRVVVRASTRGPAPADSRLREAALAMVRRRYDQLMRMRCFALVVFSAMLALYVFADRRRLLSRQAGLTAMPRTGGGACLAERVGATAVRVGGADSEPKESRAFTFT